MNDIKSDINKQNESTKKRPGRPVTKDVKNSCRTVNIAIPISLLDKWNNIKIIHNNNFTEYITKLIQKDMDSNYEQYLKIVQLLKNILW